LWVGKKVVENLGDGESEREHIRRGFGNETEQSD